MNFIKFILWLSAGAIVGWFASRMTEIENRQKREKMIPADN